MKSINSIMRRIAILTIAIVWVFVMPFSWGQFPADSAATTPKIHVHAVAADWRELDQKVKTLNAPCGGHYRYMDHPTTVEGFVGGKVREIQVVRFAAWRNAPTRKELRDAVRKVWQGKFQSVSCYIAWDEGNMWSIEAVIEFEDGKRSELIMDGMHIALQDHDGKSWFIRLLPAAQ